MSDDTLANLLVKLSGDASGMIAEWQHADKEGREILEHMGAGMSSQVAAGFLKAQVAIAAFTEVLKLAKEVSVDAVRDQLEQISAQTKLADRLGISTEALVAFTQSAERAAVPTEVLTQSIGHMEKNLSAASDETSKQAQALRELGIRFEDIQKLTPDQQFNEIAESISKVGNASDKARIAQEVFGRGGLQIIGILNEGKEGFAESAKEAEEYGLALNRLDAQKVIQANKAFRDIHDAIEGAAKQLTVALAPYLEVAATKIADMARNAGGFRTAFNDAVQRAVTITGTLLDAWHMLVIPWKGLIDIVQNAIATFSDLVIKGGSGLKALGIIAGNFKNIFIDVAHQIRAEFDFVWEWLKSGVGGFVRYTESQVAELIDKLSVALRNVKGMADTADTLKGVAGEMQRNVAKAGDEAAKSFAAAQKDVSESAQKTNDDIKNIFNVNPDDTALPAALYRFQEMAHDAAAKTHEEFLAAVNSPLPSTELKAWIADSIAAVDAAAKEISDKITAALIPQTEDNTSAIAQFKDGLNEQLLAENEYYQAQIADAEAAATKLKVSQVTKNAVLEKLSAEHAARLKGINSEAVQSERILWETSWKGKLAVAGEYLGILASLQNSKNREMFEIGKAAALANAIVTTAAGVAKTFEQLGYYALFGPAEAVALAGLAQIQTIQSASFGGGGGSTSPVPGGGTAVNTQGAPGTDNNGQGAARGTGQAIHINLGDDDEITTVGAVRKLIKKISQAQGDGALITVG